MKSFYFILSLSHGQADSCCLWWRKECAGYTKFVEEAGLYSEDQVSGNPGYFNNGTSTHAVPVDDALAASRQVVPYPFP